MIVLEEPYVSKTLLLFLEEMQIPVLKNDFSDKVFLNHPKLNILDEANFVQRYRSSNESYLYTVSEYALDWVYRALPEERIIEQISLLKNKAMFRKACRSLYDDFFFMEIAYKELFDFDVSELHLPIVLKPTIGFLSAGVYVVTSLTDWEKALQDIQENFMNTAAMFPEKVVGNVLFIIESYIQGREFAIDLYFKDQEPVIINIFEHMFSSEKDVSDRLYCTNKSLFDEYLMVFTDHISRLNTLLHLKDIPVHMELRIENDKIVPIEINPLRFTGLCLNELHYYIAGKHPLSYYFSRTVPHYSDMWKGKEQKTFSFSVFEKVESIEKKGFDSDKVKHLFDKILEYRPIDNPNLKLNACVFSETEASNSTENETILTFDVKHAMLS